MRVRVVVPPAPVVTWEEADARLQLGGDATQQPMIETMIATATAHIDGPDGWLGRAIGVQTLEARLNGWSTEAIALPYPPHIDIVSIEHANGAGGLTPIDAGSYDLGWDGLSFRSVAGWQAHGGGAVRVRYRAGYDNGEGRRLPEPIKAAILLMTGDLYAQRETFVIGTISSAVPMSTSVENLLRPFRVWR